jgi:tetratricopeptide (TPR) repeat protein
MVALADVEILRHRYSQSEALLIAALPTLEAANGADTPAMARPMASLARIALARGALLDAKYWADRANAVISRYPAASTTEPLRVIGAVDAAEDHFDEGERVLRAALARDRRAHGASSLQAARSLAQLANLLLRAQRFDKALPTIEEAIAIDQQRLGRAHPLIADDFADLGLIYAGLSRDDAACAALYYALDLLDRDPGRETPRVGYIELQLAPVLRRLGDKDAADAAFDDAKHILHAAADGEKKREREL